MNEQHARWGAASPSASTRNAASYRCGSCRIWSGDGSASHQTIVNANDLEFYALPRPLVITFEGTSRRDRGITLCSSGTQRLEGIAGGVKPMQRSLFIPVESVRMLDVYSPSPFTTTIVVQVDLDSSHQLCFFVDRVSRYEDTVETTETELSVADRMNATAFLAALHTHLADVPISRAARDLLSEANITPTTHSLGVKRRRSIAPTDFYGRRVSSETTPQSPKAPIDAPLRESSWRSFYNRLQFNVSHSLMCQLEGTAPLSASFPRQQEAFDFVDQVLAFRRRLDASRLNSERQQRDDNNAPRVFCFEGVNEGKRRFWVTTLKGFWAELYFDLGKFELSAWKELYSHFIPEFKTKLNPGVDGDELVRRLLTLLQVQLYRVYQIVVDVQRDVVELDSSTDVKFSRHLTIHFPDGHLFVDNIHAGAFVRQFVHDLVLPQGDDEPSTEGNVFVVNDSDDQKQLFIDMGVYTRNRMFRILGSSKYRKDAVLRPTSSWRNDPTEQTASSDEEELFHRSLVCPFSRRDAFFDHKRMPGVLLRYEGAGTLKRFGVGPARPLSTGVSLKSIESRTSVYPQLDAFILSIATTGGIQGEIRAVHQLYPALPAEGSDRVTESTTATTSSTHPVEPVKIVYHMMRNRWCENIGRPHKSNNVMFVVDLIQRVVVQRCHDPRCQAMDYRSEPQPLPAALSLDHTMML
ncbi:hypothetical protein PINS_up002818 [Pythium insidiosum]|nr:hypothetical protein PINS_up002818 [Pythium insidiosum]